MPLEIKVETQARCVVQVVTNLALDYTCPVTIHPRKTIKNPYTVTIHVKKRPKDRFINIIGHLRKHFIKHDVISL